MTETLTPSSRAAELAASVAQTTQNLDAMRARRAELSAQLETSATQEETVLARIKVGLSTAGELTEPRQTKDNLRRVVDELTAEIHVEILKLSATREELADHEFWENLKSLAAQAQSRGIAFDLIRHRAAADLLEALAEMDSVKKEWSEARLAFRDCVMRRISPFPAIPGLVGRHASDIVHSKALLTELKNKGVGDLCLRNLRGALPCEATFGMIPIDYPAGTSDEGEEWPFSTTIQQIFDEGYFRKRLQ